MASQMKIQICFKLPDQEKELSDARYGTYYRKLIEETLRQVRRKMDSNDHDRQAYRDLFALISNTIDALNIPRETLEI